MENTDIVKSTIRLTKEMHEWYSKEADKIGVPLNAMFIFALLQYQREQMVVPHVGGMMDALRQGQKIKE